MGDGMNRGVALHPYTLRPLGASSVSQIAWIIDGINGSEQLRKILAEFVRWRPVAAIKLLNSLTKSQPVADAGGCC